ncbi:NADH:ubiquinone oxidoreductase subunit 5 [Aquipluma nitroreducens]|uniref:NADH:ubiquinone oxidoreductase subunit 5 n=1 Tax=Aquipluma nitroreducens TaxID=2010828 RepID=A0A5K7S6E1_9BACT|nr:GxxExxY protein [Aquipluma nitroreducens]BBE17065.1 NADH:ubiquinone oxidoreductase subunit 5 [Aquipluma nitroreducens]
MDREEIFKKVLDCAFEVHTNLGPGLLESVYEECLFIELQMVGLNVEKQKHLPLIYKGLKLGSHLRLDILVENKIIVELKAVEELTDVHLAQTLTYLKLSGCKLGLLVNFNVTHLKNGIKRVIL